jgi:hypothetical protein
VPVLSSAGALAVQLSAIVFGVGCGKLYARTSTICETTFGSCSSQGTQRPARVIVRSKMNGCVWQSALLFCSDACFCSFVRSHLSVHALAGSLFDLRPGFRLPIYADVLGVFLGSSGAAWTPSGRLARTEAPGPLPTVGRSRARSGSQNNGRGRADL